MSRREEYDWSLPPRELFEQLASDSVIYWHTPGPGPKPLATGLCRTLDRLCEAARRRRTRAVIDAEIANLCRDRATLPRPMDLDEAARINRRIETLCREPSAEAEPPAMASPPAACADCIELRARLVNIYHLTITGSDAASTVRAVRVASGPGAPALAEEPRA
jgi:hypothetical protein